MKAIWNNVIIAESDAVRMVEGNAYFPKEDVKAEFLLSSDHHTTCPWKGVASYYHVSVNDDTNNNAAWYYPNASDLAKGIEGYVAFWKGVKIEE
jgi:uncharacterized protein (DUF427 family)